MIMPSVCYSRGCKHYQGFTGPLPPESEQGDEDGMIGVEVCPPYPKGIPTRIWQGEDLHLTVQPDQEGTLVYEEGESGPRY